MPRFLKQVLIFLLFFGTLLSGFAQRRQRLGFFINAAGFFPAQENVHNGLGSGLGAIFNAAQNISVSLEWKYGRFNVDQEEGGFLKGTLYVNPLLVSVHYKMTTPTSLAPYVFIGGGLFINNFSRDEDQSQENIEVRKQKIKNGMPGR